MLVKAKCVTPCWLSQPGESYTPGGGPLPDGLYEIDRDGPLASIKLGSTYCFEFDRNANPADKPHDYTCKKCGATKDPLGKKFTLASLGTHTNAEHRGSDVVADDEEDEPLDLSDRTCTICVPPRVCKTAYGLRLHNEKSHPFTSQPEKTEEVAEPALA